MKISTLLHHAVARAAYVDVSQHWHIWSMDLYWSVHTDIVMLLVDYNDAPERRNSALYENWAENVQIQLDLS